MTSQDIAIVGMSALFAGAKNLQTYWENIINKVNAVQEATDDWATPYYDPKSTESNRIYTRKGGFIGDLVEFEPTEFGIMPKSIEGSDPVHFIALKLARDALADADYIVRPFNREKTGIILGGSLPLNRGWGTVMQQGMVLDQTLELLGKLVPGIDEHLLGKIKKKLKASVPDISAETIMGLAPNIIPGRIANRLDLKGPNYVIDGACASSLLAMDLAIKELASGSCDMMLTGGVNATISPQTTMGFCHLGALSRSEVRPFDRSGNGTLLGEGVGILVLKRLSDAEADGDRIYAVIKGVGISSDGKALGLLAPRLEGEVLALERAYAQSGVDPKTVSLIEAHGTGIPLGDRTEMQALSTVFGQREEMLPTRALGSVKSAIGHCLLAAGAASTIKTALALYHKVLPPTLCDRVNPELQMEESCFYINNQTRPWIHGRRQFPRRAGVNAFGFGGINAHVVLEEYRGKTEKSPPVVQIGFPGKAAQNQWPTELCVFGAALREELIDKLERVRGFLQTNGKVNLADLAYTLSRDITGAERIAIVAKDIPELQGKLERVLEKLAQEDCTKLKTRNGIYYAANSELARREKTAFLFPGEGSQYQNMLADLCLYFPQVRLWFDFLDRIFGEQRSILPSSLIFPPPTSLTEQQRDRATEKLFQMDCGSEAVFTANMALYEILRELGIDAEVMVGHSTGENTALIASETIKIKDREDLGEKIFALNQIYEKLTAADRIPKGSQLAVGAVEIDLVKEVIAKYGLHLAMENCPNQVIIFGEPEAIAAAGKQLEQAGGICRGLPFDRAYHTPLFAGVSAAFKEYYDTMEVGPGHTSIYSCTSNQEFPQDPEAIRVIVAKQWFSQIRFTEAISALYDRGIRTFVEVGPSSNLTGFVNDILREGEKLALASNIKRRSGLEQLQHLSGCLYANGATVNFETFYKGRELQLLTLGDRPVGEEKRKGNRLELKMPIMRLQPEFVREIKAQLQSNLSTVEAKRVPEQISERQEAVPTAAIGNAVPPGSPLTPLTEGGNRLEEEGLGGIGDQNQIGNGSNGSKIMPGRSPERALLPRNGVATPEVGNLSLPEDTRLAIVQSHFDLMQEFLASQERVTGAVYQGGMFSLPTRPDLSQEAWPLLGEVLELDSQHLYCQRCFDLESDIFLSDYTGIPFTISMEMLAEAAVYLIGGDRYVVGIDDIIAYQWQAISGGKPCLDIYARVLSDSDSEEIPVLVQLFETQGLRVFEGTVKLGDRFGPAPAPRAWQWSEGQDRGFGGIKQIRSWDKEGIEADLQVRPVDDLFVNRHQPRFQLDVSLWDAAEQLIAYWISAQLGTEFTLCPWQVAAFRQYQAPLAAGSMVLCRCQINLAGDRILEANWDLLDSRGRPIARIEGGKYIYDEVSSKY